MTDKQIIIDDQKKTIHRLQDECTEKTNAIIALGEQLKAKEQECEDLKSAFVRAECQIADDEILQCDMREAIEKLEADLKQEKALKETYLACYKAKHEDIEGKLFKLSKTLTEIKDIIQNQGYIDILEEQILQKISECEVLDE